MGCGTIDFLEGGTLKNATIIGGSISNALFQGGVIDASEITQLRNIDEDSVEKIVDVMKSLPAAKLQELIAALLNALSTSGTEVPDTTKVSSLPTLMYGDSRKGMLGSPDFWVKIGGALVPGYTVADGQTGD